MLQWTTFIQNFTKTIYLALAHIYQDIVFYNPFYCSHLTSRSTYAPECMQSLDYIYMIISLCTELNILIQTIKL